MLAGWAFLPNALMALDASMSTAEGRLQFGNTQITPGVTVLGEYNDNIYLGNGENRTTERETWDWITHVQPQLLTRYLFQGRGYVGLGYKGNYAYYNQRGGNNWASHTGIFELKYDAPAGLIAGGRYLYKETEDPYGSGTEYKAGVPLVDRATTTGKWKLGYAVADMSRFLLYYNYYKQDYDDDILDYSQDYDQHEAGCGVQVRVGAKTWAFVRFFQGSRDYYTYPNVAGAVNGATDADHDWQRANIGLLWDSGGRLSGELNVGYKKLEYDSETTNIPTERYDDEEIVIAATAVTYEIASGTAMTLNIANDLKPVAADTNDYYEDTLVGIQFHHALTEKLRLLMGADYSQANYYRDNRDDDNYRAMIDLDYLIQPWLTASVGYTYREKESSTDIAPDHGDSNEYVVNKYALKISAVF